MPGWPRALDRRGTLWVTLRVAVPVVAVARSAGVALAQETPEPGAPEPAGGEGGSWLDQMNPAEWFERQREAVFDALVRLFTDPQRGLPAMLGAAVQDLLAAAWETLWGLFEPFNFFTQIPTWIVGL